MTRFTAIAALVLLLLAAGALAIGFTEIAFGMLALAAVPAGVTVFQTHRRDRAIGELRQADESLRSSEAKFAGILAIAADAIITVDARQRILHFNWGAEQIFGYSEQEMLGRPLDELLPERFRGAHSAYVDGFAHTPETARRMGHRRAIFGRRRNGEEFPAEASISKLGAGATMLFTVVLRDITEQQRQERLERFLGVSSALLGSSLDMEDTLQAVVDVARPMLADCCLLEVDVGDDERRVIASEHDDDALSAELAAIAGDRGRLNERVVKDRLRATSVHPVPLTLGGRAFGRLLLIATEERRLGPQDMAIAGQLGVRSAAAIESARLYRDAQRATRARDDVLGIVSHDLRNPLSAIAMCARVLSTSPPESPAERQKLLTAITQATDWMNRLIQDLLDVSSIEAGKLSVERGFEAVEPLVRAATAMFALEARQKLQQIDTTLDPGLPPVNADGERIVQVLQNLIGNAVKFTPDGGRISVAARREGNWVRFSVSDFGPGIPDADQPLVFDRFWHAKRGSRTGGTGLGLAIAKGIVQAHDGEIRVESKVGEGSTFSFTLPAKASP